MENVDEEGEKEGRRRKEGEGREKLEDMRVGEVNGRKGRRSEERERV